MDLKCNINSSNDIAGLISNIINRNVRGLDSIWFGANSNNNGLYCHVLRGVMLLPSTKSFFHVSFRLLNLKVN